MNSKISLFRIKLTQWEYWPWQIVYIPVFIYWLWGGLRTRNIFWINAANPAFEYGGIVGDSKKAILDLIPAQYVPITIMAKKGESVKSIYSKIKSAGLGFPIIIKPDVGERGFRVALVSSYRELVYYLSDIKENYLVQEFLDMPVELGVFYYRMPNNDDSGVVSSVVLKALLKVIGNGKLSIQELMQKDPRAAQQIERLRQEDKVDLARVPLINEEVLLEPIGNHVRGTAFLDATYMINEKLHKVFDELSKQIDGFYYGRYDIRCSSIENLYDGDFKIMELNGSASEPAHIYSPNFPLFKGYKTLLHHWRILFKICRINHKKGVPYLSFKSAMQALKKSRLTKN